MHGRKSDYTRRNNAWSGASARNPSKRQNGKRKFKKKTNKEQAAFLRAALAHDVKETVRIDRRKNELERLTRDLAFENRHKLAALNPYAGNCFRACLQLAMAFNPTGHKGEKREYPGAVVQMSEFILTRVVDHGSVGNVEVIEALGTLDGVCPCCGSGQQSALGTLFHSMGQCPEAQTYSAGLVELVAKQIQFMGPGQETSRLQLILDAVELLPDGQQWFAGEQHGRRHYLVTTREGSRALGFRARVKLPGLGRAIDSL